MMEENTSSESVQDSFVEPESKPLFPDAAEENSAPKPLFENKQADEQETPLFVKPLFPEEEKPAPAPEAELKPAPAEAPVREEKPAPAPVPVRKSALPEPEERSVYSKKKNMSFSKMPGIMTLDMDYETASLGEMLQTMRKKSGLSVQEIAAATHIKEGFIQALEKEDYEALPKGPYSGAYVRTLCSFYNLDKTGSNAAMEKIRNATRAETPEVPHEIIENLESHADKNLEEEKRIRRMFIIAGIVLLLILLLIIGGITALVISLRKPEAMPEPQPVSGMTETVPDQLGSIEKLSPPRLPVIRELDVPQK